MTSDPRRKTGVRGERVAALFLSRRGARVLAFNVDVPDGEIDLVIELDGRRIAVEVRTRWNEDPMVAFDHSKLDRVRRSARRLRPPVHRIDLVTVEFDDSGAHVRWTPDV